LQFLNELGSQSRTKDECITETRRLVSLPDDAIESTLGRLWSIIFVPEDAGEELGHAIDVWERLECKLAFECFAQSANASIRTTTAQHRFAKPHPTGLQVPLPPPAAHAEISFSKIIYQRRTCRDFDARPVALAALSSILFQGVTATPAEIMLPEFSWYIVAIRVEELRSGVYAYLPGAHTLRSIRYATCQELENELIKMQIGQPYARGSAFAVMLSASLETLFGGGPSAFRKWLICAGAAMQGLILSGVAQGLQAFPSAAIIDEQVGSMVNGEMGALNVPTHCIVLGNGALPNGDEIRLRSRKMQLSESY
jgi:hypothetical protein